jgi:hypothetical protein
MAFHIDGEFLGEALHVYLFPRFLLSVVGRAICLMSLSTKATRTIYFISFRRIAYLKASDFCRTHEQSSLMLVACYSQGR